MMNSKISSLLLFLAIVLISDANRQVSQCATGGGVCVEDNEGGKQCKTLPYTCEENKHCCEKTVEIKKTTGSRNRSWSPQSRRKGDTYLKTAIDVKIYIGDNRRRGKSPKCKAKGGICMSKKMKKHCLGVTDASLCPGEKCFCCYTVPGMDCSCGQSNEGSRIADGLRISGGEEVSPRNKYPWHVGLNVPLIHPLVHSGYLCGGAIINSLYVITAAHCLFDPFTGTPFPDEDIKIGLADHNQFSTNDDVPGVTQSVHIEKKIVHENFAGLYLPDDIALLKLQKHLDLTTHKEIKPVCLPKNAKKTYEGYDATVAGWGLQDYDNFESYSDPLLEVSVSVLGPECEGDLPSNITITDGMLCAAVPEGGKDACFFDSGGALVVKEDSSYTLIGLVSFGIGCAEPNVPGVYTRITEYLDWIAENTKEGRYCSD